MSEENKKETLPITPPEVVEAKNKPAPPPAQQQPIKLTDKDFEPALEHLETAERNLDKYIGKAGHNPFIWRNLHILPLKERYAAGERTGLLRKEMLAINKNAIPTITKGKFETINVKQGDIKTSGVGPNQGNGENP